MAAFGLVFLIASMAGRGSVSAHRSGCHRWHSCPSDTGSYVCGDLGKCSQCPDSDYCADGQPRRTSTEEPKSSTQSGTRAGVPPTGTPAYEAYKAVEVLIDRFGSEPAAVAALGTTVTKAKRVANQPRHIPEKAGVPVAGDPLALAIEAVRAYERYLLAQPA